MKVQVKAIQSDLYWESIEKNLEMFTRKIELIDHADLIVLPEMFTTGFTMSTSKFSEKMDGITINWMKIQAAKKNAVITGSIIIEENGQFYNRLIWMKPDETYEYYDKKHLFSMAKEDENYSSGSKRKIVTLNGIRFLLNICYDLRFPVWSRYQDDYDCIIYVASWPQKRAAHWSVLLKARAIENLSYVIGLNRYGTDGNDFYYSGNSIILDPHGTIIDEANDEEKVIEAIISKETLIDKRQSLPFLNDRDQFNI